MAVSIEMLKEPKYLIIGGVAVIGGLYFATKLSPRKKSSEPVEVTPSIQSVTATSDLNAQDDLQRQLTEAKQTQEELLRKQEEQRLAFEQRLADQQSRSDADRQQQGSQYGAQLASLQALIQKLEAQLAGKSGTTTGGQGTAVPSTQPTAPKPAPATYPGVNSPDVPDNTYRGLLGSYETVLATQRKKNQNSTFTARNMAAIALYGTPSPWINRGDWNLPASINYRRVHYGLRPLTSNEIQAMLKDVATYGAGGEATLNAHIPELFNKWNAPYQVGSVKRF